MHNLPPELEHNYCHIAPEWRDKTGQKLWFVSAPYGGTVLRFSGEPTSLLYAIAPLVSEIKRRAIADLTINDVALLNPVSSSETFYSELELRLQSQRLRAICISALTAGSAEARKIAQLAKSINPNTVTIFGGPHEDDITLKTAVDTVLAGVVDFSVAGDGEYALLELVKILFTNPDASVDEIKSLVVDRRSHFRDCEGLGGIYFQHRGKAEQVLLSQKALNLDKLPLMPRELLHESDTRTFSIFKKSGQNVKTAQIMTHRGCRWRCTFCSESLAVNRRSLASVINEIEQIKHFSTLHANVSRQDYKAIFFDDSTFNDRSQQRREFLQELYSYLQYSGIEWGCQTRLDMIDAENLRQMKDAGCSYVFTGLESASDEMLRTMRKDERRQQIERAFDAVNSVGMRLGVSLIFGVAQQGSSETQESDDTICETLQFVEQQVQHGNIVLISPNIATYYPTTTMTSESDVAIDFRRPIVNTGFPWNRFEEGEGHHPKGITKEKAAAILKQSIDRFGEYLVDQDIYSLEGFNEAYRSGLLDSSRRAYADLNHASISRPIRAAHSAAIAISKLNYVSREDRQKEMEEARGIAAALMGVTPSRRENIVLTRNTTEAASLAFWLAGLHLKRRPTVLTTNAENMSVPRAFKFHMDHGNSSGRDLWSSYQDFGVQKTKDYLITMRSTQVELKKVDVLSDTRGMEEKILENMTPETDLIVFCHVIRDDGRICDVTRLCADIRKVNPDAFILVDGAQALGALPQIDVEEMGCDFYVAAPHKTLGSFPIGLLYMSERAKVNVRFLPRGSDNGVLSCIILDGMFAESLGVSATVETELSIPEIVGFVAAVKSLEQDAIIVGNDCVRLDQNRRNLKEHLSGRLREFPLVELTSPVDQEHSNFILTFRFKNRDNRRMVESLWRDHLVFMSYIARTDSIRASFGPITTIKDLDLAIDALRTESSKLTRSHLWLELRESVLD